MRKNIRTGKLVRILCCLTGAFSPKSGYNKYIIHNERREYMPESYAHFSMGCKVADRLPRDICKRIIPYKNMFFIGLHGPDIFFYYHPAVPNRIALTGHSMHGETPAGYIAHAKEVILSYRGQREKNMAFAYVCGSICHYYLDRECHAVIHERGKFDPLYHFRAEKDLDKALYHRDRLTGSARNKQDYHVIPSEKCCGIISDLYENISPKQILRAAKGHRFYCELHHFSEKLFYRLFPEKNKFSVDKSDIFLLRELYDLSVDESIAAISALESYIFHDGRAPVFLVNFKGR